MEVMEMIDLAGNRDRWPAFVYAVMSLRCRTMWGIS
jgi:hypothetical protein